MNEGTAGGEAARGRRILLVGLATGLPGALALAVAAVDGREPPGRPPLPCPLYPNAVVAFAAELHEGCPLEPGDSILGIEVAGRTESVDSGADLVGRLE